MSIRKYPYYLFSILEMVGGFKNWAQVARVFLNRQAALNQMVELRRSGLCFKTRGIMDIWSVKETFLDRFYERFGTPIGDGWKVIDVGGGIGDFTIFAALDHPRNVVYAFEPTPQSFALLQENLRLNNITNVQAFAEAVWSQDGVLTIDTTVGEPGQYTSHRDQKNSPNSPYLAVPSLSLSDVFARLNLESCDLLKLDCEGAEYAILFNTPDQILQRIQRIVMEYHDGVTQHNHTELAKFLREHGFKVETFTNYVHDSLGYLRACREEQP